MVPALRRELASAFVKSLGLNQSKAAKLLHVDRAAVSQYVHSKRASTTRFPKNFSNQVLKSAKRIAADEKMLVQEMSRLLGILKRRGVLCNICLKYNEGVLAICPTKRKC